MQVYSKWTCSKGLSAAGPIQGSGTQDCTVDSWDLKDQAHCCIRDLDSKSKRAVTISLTTSVYKPFCSRGGGSSCKMSSTNSLNVSEKNGGFPKWKKKGNSFTAVLCMMGVSCFKNQELFQKDYSCRSYRRKLQMMTTIFHENCNWSHLSHDLTCKHLTEDTAKSPQITGDACAPSSQHLWSTVQWKAWRKADENTMSTICMFTNKSVRIELH